MKVFPHQAAAFEELVARAETYFDGKWREITSLQTKFHTLVAGSSGTGKSRLMDFLAASVGASALRIATPGWMPAGAHNRSVKETVSSIASHIIAHDRTILVLDEIDKIYKSGNVTDGGGGGGTDTGWLTYIRGEIYQILDGRFDPGMRSVTDDDDDSDVSMEQLSEKLRNSVFVVGIGTFQDFFDQSPKVPIGFGGSNESLQQIDAAEAATRLPREMANRFHGGLVVLPPLEPQHYKHIAKQAAKSLPVWIQPAFLAAAYNRIEDAIASKKGVRFAEEALLDALMATREPAHQPQPECT